MATARKTDRTYIGLRDDGSHEVNHFYEVVHDDGRVVEFRSPGAAEFTTDCLNGQWQRSKPYNGVALG